MGVGVESVVYPSGKDYRKNGPHVPKTCPKTNWKEYTKMNFYLNHETHEKTENKKQASQWLMDGYHVDVFVKGRHIVTYNPMGIFSAI